MVECTISEIDRSAIPAGAGRVGRPWSPLTQAVIAMPEGKAKKLVFQSVDDLVRCQISIHSTFRRCRKVIESIDRYKVGTARKGLTLYVFKYKEELK